MLRGARQAGRAIALVLLLLANVAGAAERGPYATQLANECDALIQAAVQRPYGWGWDTVTPASPVAKNTPRHITMEPLGSPSAGLVLLWSSRLLTERKYKQAALDAARGIVAAQNSTGKIPQRAIFGSTAGGRDAPALVPERAATRASLVLLLALIQDDPSGSERLTGPAQRAALWLAKQQADDGGWIVGYPPDAAPRQGQRLIRLDIPEYRDCTYTMLLAGDAIKTQPLMRGASRSGEKLLALRLSNRMDVSRDASPELAEIARHAVHLWSPAYQPAGAIDEKLAEFPMSADIVASKYSMQTLMGVYLMTGDKAGGVALDSAARAVRELRGNAPKWRRGYITTPTTQPTTQPATRSTTAPTTRGGSTFEPPPPPRGIEVTGTFGVEPTLDAVQQLKLLGRDKYLTMLAANLTVRQQMAAAVCGFTDNPLTLELPVSRDEVGPYLEKTAAQWAALQGSIPEDLESRVKRLWLLFLRAKIEQLEAG